MPRAGGTRQSGAARAARAAQFRAGHSKQAVAFCCADGAGTHTGQASRRSATSAATRRSARRACRRPDSLALQGKRMRCTFCQSARGHARLLRNKCLPFRNDGVHPTTELADSANVRCPCLALVPESLTMLAPELLSSASCVGAPDARRLRVASETFLARLAHRPATPRAPVGFKGRRHHSAGPNMFASHGYAITG